MEKGDGVLVAVDPEQESAHFVEQAPEVLVESQVDVPGHHLEEKVVDPLRWFDGRDKAKEENEGEGQDFPGLVVHGDRHELENFC